MPKLQINNDNAVIYKICCGDVNVFDIYIGSTTNFRARKQRHKNNSKDLNSRAYNLYVYEYIRDNRNWDNWDMVEIENFKCNDSNELHFRGRYYIELLKAELNRNIPIRTKEEHIARHK